MNSMLECDRKCATGSKMLLTFYAELLQAFDHTTKCPMKLLMRKKQAQKAQVKKITILLE